MNDQPTHPIFRNRPDSNAKLWRYLIFDKFKTLLKTKSIHFTRIDKFGDHFEGVWPKSDLHYFNGVNPNLKNSVFGTDKVAVSCWIESNYESAAMWGLYAPGNQGLAITSTYGQLEAVINRYNPTECNLSGVGRVQYIDHISEGMITEGRLPNFLWPYMLKNISYEYEKEVRALLLAKYDYEISPEGVDVEIDPFLFIKEIFINPSATDRFRATTKALLEKYGLEGKYRESSLSRRMFYWADGEQGEK